MRGRKTFKKPGIFGKLGNRSFTPSTPTMHFLEGADRGRKGGGGGRIIVQADATELPVVHTSVFLWRVGWCKMPPPPSKKGPTVLLFLHPPKSYLGFILYRRSLFWCE